MTDLELITQLRPDVPLPEPGELGAVRGRLTHAIAAESAVAAGRDRAGGRPGRPRMPRPRILVPAGALTVAAGLAIALIAVPSEGRGPVHASRDTITLTAAQFLDRAASVVQGQTLPVPGRNQFVYSENEISGGQLSQTWLSVDGERPGQSGRAPLPTCAQARKENQGDVASFHCTAAVNAGYHPNLPTQQAALRRYLKSIDVIASGPVPAGVDWAANNTGKAMDSLMSTTYLLPAQRAALFRFMAGTPGFTIVPHVRDAIGRIGVAIRWTWDGSNELILDPATYAYLGMNAALPGEPISGHSGSALIKLAIVNHAGQQP